MTAKWRETVVCPRCHTAVSTEQPIKTWIRQYPELDSMEQCLCIGDSDLWVLRYGIRTSANRNRPDREVMYLMLVEIKTHGANLTPAQQDQLSIINQVIRTDPWKEQRVSGRFIGGHDQNVRHVFSPMAKKQVRVISYGVHLLRMSGSTPTDSDWIGWDGKPISAEQLVNLLRFDLNPDTLRVEEHRNHKRVIQPIPTLPGVP